jgi:hypothetical protein
VVEASFCSLPAVGTVRSDLAITTEHYKCCLLKEPISGQKIREVKIFELVESGSLAQTNFTKNSYFTSAFINRRSSPVTRKMPKSKNLRLLIRNHVRQFLKEENYQKYAKELLRKFLKYIESSLLSL